MARTLRVRSFAAAAIAVALLGCSAALDFEGECLTDRGCESLGERLVCVDQRCVADSEADPPLPEGVFSESCDTLLGAPSVDRLRSGDYVLLGALVPRSGPLGGARPAIEAAISTALDDINGVGGVDGTRFAVLVCAEGDDVEGTVTAARHLVETLHLDAVIGASVSEVTVAVLQRVTRPRGVLLVSPGSPSPALADLPDDGLLWRSRTPSDVAAEAAAELMRAGDPERVMLLFDPNSWGTATAAIFNRIYCAGDEGRCAAERFQGVSLAAAEATDALRQLVRDFAPTRVVLMASEGAFNSALVTLTEAGVTSVVTVEGARSRATLDTFLGLDNAGDSGLPAATYQARLAVACEHVGITSGGAGPGQEAWRFDFEAKNPGLEVTPVVPVFADSVYLLAYAVAAVRSSTSAPLSGARLAKGMERLSAGHKVTIGASDWPTGIAVLASSSSATIDYLGASGDLQFDPRSGDALGPAEAWRFNVSRRRAVGAGIVRSVAGVSSPLNDALVGDDCACAPFRASATCPAE